jgi:hypothetical protein
MAAMFGDEIVVSLDALHVDHGTHQVVVEKGTKDHKEDVGV